MGPPPAPSAAKPPPQPAAPPQAPPPAAPPPAAAPAPPVRSSYEPPSWAAEPASAFSLEVIKDGCVLETVDVSARSHYILGRAPQTADIVVAHPSVSRQHAVLQHSETGEVFLMDLDSTHGTQINRKALTARSYVALRIGASVRLGQSSRVLTLMGDADPAREDAAIKARAAKAEEAKAKAAEERAAARAARIAQQTGRSQVSANDLHEAGAGWGFDAEAEAAEGDEGGGGEGADDDDLGSAGFDALVEVAKEKGLKQSVKQGTL